MEQNNWGDFLPSLIYSLKSPGLLLVVAICSNKFSKKIQKTSKNKNKRHQENTITFKNIEPIINKTQKIKTHIETTPKNPKNLKYNKQNKDKAYNSTKKSNKFQTIKKKFQTNAKNPEVQNIPKQSKNLENDQHIENCLKLI